VLPETDRDHALSCAARLRDAVAQRVFLQPAGLAVRLTASFGVATFPDDGPDEEAILRLADMAMYRVKESGRNNVAAADPHPPLPLAEDPDRRRRP